MSVRDPRDVLLAPVISEKSYGLLDGNQYTFIVLPEANKTQIKIAVEQIFNVKVLGVNTINRQGKRKRSRGTQMGKRKDTKRAIVSVAPGERIEIFGGPGGRGARASDRTEEIDKGLQSDGYPQVQADDAGPTRLERRRLRRGHEGPSREVAGPAAARPRRAQRPREGHRAAPGRRAQACLPPDRLPPGRQG